ncbi:NPCBM/NEW2 domain-containing protein [uncultured Bacteroides sp.]
MPQKNQAVVWTPSPLTVNGVTYERGVGVHSIKTSAIWLDLCQY